MPAAPQPRMHGISHVHGGPDPILIAWEDVGAGELLPYVDLITAHPALRHYWPCDEATGPTLADHATGGTLVGGWPLSEQRNSLGANDQPQYGKAGPIVSDLSLTAVSNAGNAGPGYQNGRFNLAGGGGGDWAGGTAAWTVELWLYLEAFSLTGGSYYAGSIVMTGMPETPSPPHYSGIDITIQPNVPGGGGSAVDGHLRVTRGGGTIFLTLDEPSVFPLHVWRHVVVRYTPPLMELIVNGGLAASGTDSSSTPMGSYLTFLNRDSLTSALPFTGRMAQVAFYNAALTNDEIVSHYEAATT